MSDAVNRGGRKRYPLRNVAREDYTSSRLRGTPASRRVADIPELDREESSTDMDQLVVALTELTMFQKEQQRRMEETQRQQEEHRLEEQQLRQQQYEQHQEQIRVMHQQHVEQMEAMKGVLKGQEAASPHLKIAPYQETEDIQDFLEAFEGIMKIQKVNKTNWVLQLTPLLSGKARTVCTDLGSTKAYEELKKAILEHCNVNSERCRKRFRAHIWTKDQEPTEWITKGIKLAKRWLLPEEGVDQVVNKVAVEQFLNGLPQEMRIWVASHDPETPEKVAQLIESYDSAHTRSITVSERSRSQSDYRHQQKTGTPSKDASHQRRNAGSTNKPRERKPLAEIICHKGEKKGHIARNCPAKSLRVKEELEQVLLFGEGEVNGQPVQRIQIDSGASRTVVDRRLVPVKDIGDETITVTFGNGTSGEYPLAPVRVTFDGDEYEVKAAVVQGLTEDVLLGRDVPLHKHMVSRLPRGEQMDLLRQLAEKHHVQIQETKEEETAMAVMTRSQKQRMDQQLAETFIPQGGDRETPDESNETADHIGEEFPFEEDLFEPTTRTKTHQMRAERREHNLRWNKMQNVSSTMQLKTEQEKDPSVQKWLQQEDPSRVVRKEGVLCRVWTPRHSPGTTYEQIVLPKPYHSKVIQLAHDLPFAGHLGREKTAQRILRRFYWPTLFHDVKEYCQTCEECQVHGSHRSKAPMISLPTIGEPFKRIAMDVVGPLPRTSRGNRFILVVSDYATRYPEAIPLPNVTAKTVAEVLIDLFARYGIPEEILTDQGTNFTSALLGELY